jgi:hypothetical protein
MKMAKYRKRCFDQIDGVMSENKTLTGEVDRLQLEVEEASKEGLLERSRWPASLGNWPRRVKSKQVRFLTV